MNALAKNAISNVYELLSFRASPASGSAQDPAFTFLANGEQASGSLTFHQLGERARELAAHIQQATQPHDRVLLVYPPGLDYIVAFFACMYAGVIAVPALPPSSKRTLPRLKLMAVDAQPRIALSSAEIGEQVAKFDDDGAGPLRQLSWIASDQLPAGVQPWHAPTLCGSDIAFLQYTSGSTGAPKGVMVSHANVLANVAVIQATFELVSTDPIISWLPPHHDMGLIGKILLPVHAGCHCIHFPPAAFLARPYRWLKAISDYKARITAAPNFAYDLCVSKISEEQKATLDLSSLDYMLNGAEAVRSATLQAFTSAFAPCGLRPEVIAPVYGLAESTLLVAGSGARRGPGIAPSLRLKKAALAANVAEIAPDASDTVDIVSCGLFGIDQHLVAIADPGTLAPLADGQVGEVLLHGGSIGQGYWNRPEESARTFFARIVGQEREFLRTGDLGFIQDGQLYITGRIKEMMIFAGRNIYPQDIETSIEAMDPAFRSNGCAVFALQDGSAQQLVIIQEVESRMQAQVEGLVGRLQGELAEVHELTGVAGVVLVKAGRIPRTSSGKIQRLTCRQLYQDNGFDPIWEWRRSQHSDGAPHVAPRNEGEARLAVLWCRLLELDQVSVHANFFDLGGHSLLATQLASALRAELGVSLTLRALFEAPTIAELAERVALAERDGSASMLPMTLADRNAPLALSFAQQRLWFLDQFERGSALYNMPAACRLSGALDADALRRALNEIVRRHESLRTSFDSIEGVPVQIVAAGLTLALELSDLSALEAGPREAQARALVQQEAVAPFDLSSGPLVRAALVRMAPDQHILLLTMHHIVSDGWSMGVLMRELAALYGAYSRGQTSPLAEPAVQYADFAQWQRAWLRADVLEQQLAYWRVRLADAPTLLSLPTDRPRPLQQSYRGAMFHFQVGAATTAALRTVGQGAQATLFMTLTAAFNILLARYSGQSDICVGTPIANRNHADIEELIGFFVNTLVLRTEVTASASFAELLQQVRQSALDAYAHQDVPFEQLVDTIKPERHTSHAALFQVMFILQNTPMTMALPGLGLETLEASAVTARYDLALTMTEQNGQLAAAFEYNTDLFDASTMARMAGHFTRLLDAIAAAPAGRISDFDMLGAAERTAIVQGWNATASAYPQDQTIVQMFEAQVAATPDAPALAYGNAHLSYGQLNARANQLAHHLRTVGVGPEVLVGLCTGHCFELVIGILGVLKAGGAYLPLDPAYPAERLAYMLEDARPLLVLTQTSLLDGLDFGGLDALCIDNLPAALCSDNPQQPALPSNLAYTIYTSGSSGRPKGVLLQHGGLRNLAHVQIQAFGLKPQDRVLQFASINFDASTFEIFFALGAGATLCLAERDDLMPGIGLEQTLHRMDVTVASFPPAAMSLMATEGLERMHTLIVAGDACPPALVRQWAVGRSFINGYGPTEGTVSASLHWCQASDEGAPPIGRPIVNVRMYILDADMQVLPAGVAGQVFIAGAGLARGYLNRADLTAASFIPDPFSATPGARLYKSGDLARYRADGSIEYLGRVDSQVKIRGFRIELGEIEVALAAIDGVREALVLAREDAAGDKRLVAWVAGQADVGDLRAALLQSLPDYMVPAYFVRLDAFPLTANGKIDRKALPEPDLSQAMTAYVAPRTDDEKALAAIWADVLKREQVGVHDNFFALGGHSLLATQVVAKLRTAYGIELPLRAIFEAGDLQTLAHAIPLHRHEAAALAVPAIHAVARDGDLALSFAQQRLWFLNQLETGSAFYNMPGSARLTGRLDVSALARSLNAIMERHEALRTRIESADGMPVQRIDPQQILTLMLTDISALGRAERETRATQLARDEAAMPFDLATGPVIRARLVRLCANEHVLLVTLHHIVSDGWSIGVLMRELAALYAANVQGKPSPLAPLPVQYADYANWQRQWLQGAVLESQLGYWETQLSGAPALLSLPTDRARPPVQSYRGALHGFTVGATTVAALNALGRQRQATLFMTLAAAFNVLLARYAGQTDISIGTPIANRRLAEVEPLIGLFVNTLVLRSQVDASATFNELLAQVRANALGAYAHQDVPFEQVVERLKPVRELSHAPLFQVMFILQNAPMEALELSDLTLDVAASDSATTKYDLRLEFMESAGTLEGSFQYSTDLFDAATIARMAEHFVRLLEAVAAAPQTPIGMLSMQDQSERAALLAQWNRAQPGFLELSDSALAVPQAADNVLALFAASAAHHPDNVAVAAPGRSCTYAELDQRANRLANALLAVDTPPQSIVALLLDDPLDQIVATLGVLKAGCVFASLNTAHPVQRLQEMLAVAAPFALVTGGQAVAPAVLDCVARRLVLDESAAWSDAAPSVAVRGEQPCYLYFTSGSTGKPKAVLGRHAGLAHFIQWEIASFDIGPGSKVSQLTNPGFDVYLRDIFTPLCAGATVCIPDAGRVFEPQALAEWIESSGVNLIHCVPSVFRLLLDAGLTPQRLPALKHVLLAGEALLPADANRWIALFGPRIGLVNLYGPTETTLAKFFYRLPGTLIGEAFVPVGRPMPGAQAIILKDNLEPCAQGEIGELYIRTPYRSLGYYGSPDLNRDAFIANPYSPDPQDVLYKTGDLARLLDNGQFQHVGRKDFQVKIRGMRIELGEIETALAALPGVRAAVVLAVPSASGEKRLVAYVAAEVQPQALREALLAQLPDYMVPGHFVVLERLPLNANGKIDRKALPQPEEGSADTPYLAPRNAQEAALCAIWAELLECARVGVNDNFFALGGHSLLAMRIMAKVGAEFGVGLPLRALFEAPTVALLALKVAAAAPLEQAAIVPVSRAARLPLSYAQRRFWYLDQYDHSGNAQYWKPFGLRLRGTCDAAVLQAVLDALLMRHESLRTVFAQEDGVPFQVIVPELCVALQCTDLDALAPHARDQEVARVFAAEAAQPFQLSQGPLLRARLLKISESEHIFVLTLHHILYDGWSFGVLLREVVALYEAFEQGGVSPLAALPIQYADYASWEHHGLEHGAPELDFWKARLAQVPDLLALPIDRPRPARMEHRGATHRSAVSAGLTEALGALARAHNATVFMVLAAALKVQLQRYTGQDEVCIGVLSANRPPQTESLIGIFINVVPLSGTVDRDERFVDLLARTAGDVLVSYEKQLPFELILEHCAAARSAAYVPFAQVAMNFHNEFDPGQIEALSACNGALEMSHLQIDAAEHSYFEIKLDVGMADGALQMAYEYNTALFDAASIARWSAGFETLLAAICEQSTARVGDLPLLNAAQRQVLVHDWNATAVAYPQGLTLAQLFEAQVAATPHAAALEFEGAKLSYAELNARANRMAHKLRSLGVGPDVLVAICAERSLELVIGLLAIVKAGGAYVPLDPSYPADRLAYMLADAAPAVLLAGAAQRELLAQPALALEDLFETCSDVNPVHLAGPANLAYVIYTSGSTGRPKGVGVDHAGIVNRLQWMQQEYGLGADDRVLQKTPYSFDVSVWEFFWPLMTGASLVVARPGGHTDPDYLAALIEQAGITTLHFVPPMLDVFLANQPACTPLRQVMCSGQALPLELQRRFLAQLPNVALHNLYGPTEASVDVTYRHCQEQEGLQCVPIGRPIANIQIYLLDAALNPVPQGAAGELHIAGVGLARGYINRPDLTADKFIANPFGEPGARMYKSGDLARHLADGSIEYLGRIDNQVKLRGLRIELGEIEAALASRDNVRDALVLAREDAPGQQRLVAYVVGAVTVDELRSALLRTLPDYMVPAHFVLLDEFPLTSNGKVDRKALPAPDVASAAAFVAPATEREIALAAVWAELLKIEQVGVHDNFFALGGHSLLATQVVSKLRTVHGIELPLRELFEAPDLQALARSIEDQGEQPLRSSLPAIVAVAHQGDTALSFAQQRLWFIDQFEPGTPLYNIPVVMNLSGALDIDALKRTLDEVVRRHAVLRTCFVTHEGKARQVILPELSVGVPMADLNDLVHAEREAKAQWIIQDEIQTSFNLASGPLLRARLIRLEDSEHIFVLTLHHIISDGWSMGVLMQEVSALYTAFVQNLPSPLAPLAIQYADYAHWQHQWLAEAVLDEQLGYWRDRLAGAPSLLTLPTDRPRPALESYRGATHEFLLAPDATAALMGLATRTRTTLFMTLAAAFNILLSRYAGQDDVSIGTPIANRNHAEIEPLIGFFVNTLVLRTTLDGAEKLTDLLARVRNGALEAYAHQDVPFEQVVEAVKPDRHASHAPLFQVMLVLQNMPASQVELPNLTMQAKPVSGGNAKFDLTLTVVERRDGLSASFEYATDLFDASTIARMGRHFARLLEAMAANPESRVGELEMLDASERRHLLEDWNATSVAYPQGLTLVQLFEAQVAATPDALALQYEDQQLSYTQLNARVNRLAHELREHGVGPDVLVAVCAERSLEMVVGLLAIVKAGGAYVPLDPSYPVDRLAYMLADAAPAVVLAGAAQRALLTCPTLALEDLCSDCSSANPVHVSGPANLAYVIYTSGSTGRPKGVGVDHAGIVNRLQWMQQEYSLTADDRVLQKTPYSFDVSVWEFFWPLMTGAALVMARPGGHQDPEYLATLIEQARVTTLHFVPPMLDVFLATQPACTPLRQVMCSGQALPLELQRRFLAQLPHVALHNLYGPTEASVDVTYRHCREEAGLHCVPIGRPIANIQIYLLDAGLNPVPPGAAGELHIAGVGLARGYINRPDLTADKFIANPFGAPGSRMYKSGDLARYLADGSIEYLGRIDNQVKIRGLRIELGEIESALAEREGVRDALVLVREDTPGQQRLVAYLAGNADIDGLRSALLQRLPDYMVPAHFVMLDTFPLTSNGKVDRKALPVPDMAADVASFVAPRTPNEVALAEIWADVLKLERVGMHDNFFHLGGDSILSIQVIARARQAGLFLTPKELFQNPTIEALAMAAQTSSVVKAEQGAVDGAVALTPIQHWFLEQDLAQPQHFNQSVILKVQREVQADLLDQALKRLVQQHDALRLRYSVRDERRQQEHDDAGSADLAVFDLSGLEPARQVAALAEHGATLQAGIDLAHGPLLQVAYFRLGPDSGRLLLICHHLVVDGVSWRILIEDLNTVYGQLVAGQSVALMPKTSSFQHWAQRLLGYAAAPEREQERSLWERNAQVAAPQLPLDYPDGVNSYAAVESVRQQLSAEQTGTLLTEVPQAYRTQINDVLLAALSCALADWMPGEELAINLEGHGREDLFDDVDVSRTVGWFTAMYPLRLALDRSGDYGTVLKTVKEQLRAVPDKGVGFGMLRYLSPNPLATGAQPVLMFNYLGQVDQLLDQSALFAIADEAHGPDHAPGNRRAHEIEMTAIVTNGSLQLAFAFNTQRFARATIDDLAAHYLRHLSALIAHCVATPDGAGGYTPSDFALADLDQDALNMLLDELNLDQI